MGVTVVDAGVVIGFLDAEDAHHTAAEAALRDARDRRGSIILPASALAEVLVGPWRSGPSAVHAVQHLIDRLPMGIHPLDTEIALRAAELRARHRSLKLPDAMVIATASHLDADHLLTTDRRWPTRSKLGLRARVQQV